MELRKLNDVTYFCSGTTIGKCRIDEIFQHQKQDETIVKYAVHIYGIKEYITLNDDQLFDSLVDVKKLAQVNANKEYEGSKEGINGLTYELYLNEVNKKKEELEAYYLQIVNSINNATDETFDEKEKELTTLVNEEK